MTKSRTMAELKKLEEQRADLVKRMAGGDPMGKMAESLTGLDQSIAARMGVTVDQLHKMRGD